MMNMMTSRTFPNTATDFASLLAVALQPAAALDHLHLFLPNTFPNQTYALQNIRVVAQKAHLRAVIRYQLVDEDRGITSVIYGKLYSELARAQQVYSVMQTLWRDKFCQDADLGMPQPIGIASGVPLLFYLPVEGTFLHELLYQERGPHWIGQTARWLAQLHQRPLLLARGFDLPNEVANVQLWCALVEANYPSCAPMVQALMQYLVGQAAKLQLIASAPIHKDFHYQHVLVNRRLSVIDFDELRMGDPAFDIAHFCAYLQLLDYRTFQNGAQSAAQSTTLTHKLQADFIQSYSEQTGWVLDERFIYFFAYTCIKLAKQLCTERGPYPRPSGIEAERQTRFILSKGVEILSCS